MTALNPSGSQQPSYSHVLAWRVRQPVKLLVLEVFHLRLPSRQILQTLYRIIYLQTLLVWHDIMSYKNKSRNARSSY